MNQIWVCDKCGQPITSIDDGQVEWLCKESTGESYIKQKFKLVHRYDGSEGKQSCQYNEQEIFKRTGETVGDLPLGDFIGADGLMTLLKFISDNPQEEIIELAKRIQIPLYDQVRGSIKEAISYGVFEPNDKPGFYSQDQLRKVFGWLSGENQ